MSEQSIQTIHLQAWVKRIRAGDLAARDELIRACCNRLERLASKMLSGFRNLRPMSDTGDILNAALVRLMETLGKIDPIPDSTRAFFGLAACHIRRELLDLVRHYNTARRGGSDRPVPLTPGEASSEVPDRANDPDDLERWGRFHEAVESLPAEEREIVGLKFYHGWTEVQIAELFDVAERTVRRRWRSACASLAQTLDGEFPE
jgi:RNA polymerase sigma-70 factor (ECF subfamily)